VLINEAASRVTPPEDIVVAAGRTSASASSEQRFLAQLIGAPAEPGLPLWDELATTSTTAKAAGPTVVPSPGG
jgi:hypothetical protein